MSTIKLTLKHSYDLICHDFIREIFQLTNDEQCGRKGVICSDRLSVHIWMDHLRNGGKCAQIKNAHKSTHCLLCNATLTQFSWCQHFVIVVYFFPSKPQIPVLPIIICYFAPLPNLMPQHHSVFPIFCLCHPSYLSPSSQSLPNPLPLKPEGLSRSTQITSLRLCICFQSHAINQASLGMFLSFSSSSIFLPLCSFLSCFFLGPQLTGRLSFFFVTQIKTM